MITTLLLSLPLALLQAPEQRPGLVAIPGGPTVIGSDLEPTSERIRERPDPGERRTLAGEYRRSTQDVDAFYISPTLVTNEMYLEFVNATGAVPPSSWAVLSKERRLELIAAGKEEFGAEYIFDNGKKAVWWSNHWQDEGQRWEMAADIALEPVVTVSFLQVQAYCAWAGLRIPTEQEWTRAARGDTDFDYPFGATFDPTLVSHNATEPRSLAYKLLPVCSMENASPYGIYDMVGLVHEYTDSRAVRLEGWKFFTVERKDAKGKTMEPIDPTPVWDPNRILIKGGSYGSPAVFCRIDTRIPFDRDFAGADVVGFRVASSATPMIDSAYLRCQNIRSSVIGGTPSVILDFSKAIGVEKHSYMDLDAIAAKRGQHEDVKEVKLPDGYAVFGPHKSLSLTPLKDPFENDKHAKLNVIDKTIKKSAYMVPVAALYTDVALSGFDVTPGAYTVVYMPGLKNKEIEEWGGWVKGTERIVVVEGAEGEAEQKAEPDDNKIKPSVDISAVELIPGIRHLLLVNREEIAVAAFPVVGTPDYAKEKKVPHGVTFRKADDKKVTSALIFQFRVAGKGDNVYGFTFELAPRDDNGNDLCDPELWNPVP